MTDGQTIRLVCTGGKRSGHAAGAVRLEYDDDFLPEVPAGAKLLLPRLVAAVELRDADGELVLWNQTDKAHRETRRGAPRESVGFRYASSGHTFVFACRRCSVKSRVPAEKLALACKTLPAVGVAQLDISRL